MLATELWPSAKSLHPTNPPKMQGAAHRYQTVALTAFLIVLLAATSSVAVAIDRPDDGSQKDDGDVNALKRMSLEDLVGVEVTIASKSPKRISDIAAAVFVITADDIARSGATTIPGLLRMVPGMQVGRVDNRTWAVGIRGFNGRFSNKLLVQIDGRSVYTPLFSGVFWDVQNLLLEDIDRIEVVRGPGATLWGANAVNGIVNIITKSSSDTDGTLISAGLGDSEVASASFRHGGEFGSGVNYRFSAIYHDRDTPLEIEPALQDNDWRTGQGSFRFDWGAGGPDSFVLRGDFYEGRIQGSDNSYSLTPPYDTRTHGVVETSGANALFRWTRSYGEASDSQLQVYYDLAKRKEVSLIRMNASILDLDWQHQFKPGDRHRMVWGMGHRSIQTRGSVSPSDEKTDYLWSTFLQDEVGLLNERIQITIGSKLEHNPYSGFELQPSARFLFKFDETSALWGAVSRAVRTPSRLELNAEGHRQVIAPFSVDNPSPFPLSFEFTGDPGFTSEDVLSYEAGYRNTISSNLTIDVAAFFSDYENLRTLEITNPVFNAGPGVPPHLELRAVAANGLEGTTRGIELAMDFQPTDWWQLRTAYSYLNMDLRNKLNSSDSVSEQAEGQSPDHQVSVRSSFDIRSNVFLDAWFRYVDTLPTALPGFAVPAYSTLDARIAWRANDKIELSLIGQDLLSTHSEFGSEFVGEAIGEVGRAIFARIKWEF